MRASLDGLSFDGSTVLEIKCPMNVRDQTVAQQGSVPPQYYAQLQHQLEVSRATEVHYWSFDGSAGTLIRVRPDREYQKRLLDARSRVLAARQGKRLARAGGRRTRPKRRSEMA